MKSISHSQILTHFLLQLDLSLVMHSDTYMGITFADPKEGVRRLLFIWTLSVDLFASVVLRSCLVYTYCVTTLSSTRKNRQMFGIRID